MKQLLIQQKLMTKMYFTRDKIKKLDCTVSVSTINTLLYLYFQKYIVFDNWQKHFRLPLCIFSKR